MVLSNDERDELRATARSLLAGASSPTEVRAAIATPTGFDPDLWTQMVELGWTSIHVPERHGGAGCGWGDLAPVLQELGRALTPSPLLASTVLATGALVLADNEALVGEALPSLATGLSLGTVALAGSSGSCDSRRLTTQWESARNGSKLSGSSGFVLDADLANLLLVAARSPDGTVAALALDSDTPGVTIERQPTIDQTRRLFTVSFDGVAVDDDHLLCDPGASAERLFDGVLAMGVVATACDAAGAAGAVLEHSAAHARDRIQFGKPIGSFQAVKHHCANMAISVEASRAASQAAAEALDGDPDDWGRIAAVTSSYVGPACSEACALGLLVHGGIGFTWEHDAHLYLKRVKLDELLFGTPSWHRRRLADAVFPRLVHSQPIDSQPTERLAGRD